MASPWRGRFGKFAEPDCIFFFFFFFLKKGGSPNGCSFPIAAVKTNSYLSKGLRQHVLAEPGYSGFEPQGHVQAGGGR